MCMYVCASPHTRFLGEKVCSQSYKRIKGCVCGSPPPTPTPFTILSVSVLFSLSLALISRAGGTFTSERCGAPASSEERAPPPPHNALSKCARDTRECTGIYR